jgi:hypothetical protein
MEAGMLATLIVGAIRTAAEFTSDPGDILSLLNKRMQGRGLATCLALRVERDGSATLANAGHLPPYLNGNELPMEGALPLGAVPGISFPVLPFKLAEGDELILITDGVAEAQDAAGHLFGFERIGEMLRTGAAASALAAAAQAFGQEDDITVLMVARMAALARSLFDQSGDLGERHVERASRQVEHSSRSKLSIAIAKVELLLRLDDPDCRNAHLLVLGELFKRPRHRVFGRQNFEGGKRRMSNHLFSRSAAAEQGYIRNAEMVWSCLHAQLGARQNSQLLLASEKVRN